MSRFVRAEVPEAVLHIIAGIDLLVSRTPAGFAASILRLIRDPQLRARLQEQARQTVTARYGWDAIGKRQTQIYRRLRAV